MKKTPAEIKNYWENRAANDTSPQSTTMDIWLRDIESKFLSEAIKQYNPKSVCDVGCGDGLTTISCAMSNPSTTFTGFDYSGIPGLSNELTQKLKRTLPANIFQASKIEGMTPAALLLLISHVRRPSRRLMA
jgi:tRNA G46 methylase TrmB